MPTFARVQWVQKKFRTRNIFQTLLLNIVNAEHLATCFRDED